MDDAYENRFACGEGVLLRRHVAELEHANKEFQERLTALERERDDLRAELTQAMSGREQMFRATLDAITETVAVVDRSGVIQAVNRTAADRLGCSKEELVGRDGRDPSCGLVPADVRNTRFICLDGVVRTGEPMRVVDARGGMTFDQTYYPVFDESGQVTRVVVFARDITEQKAAQQKVKGLQQQIEFILGAAKMGLDIIDRDFNLRYVDPSWQQVYGSYEGRKCYEYFMGADKMCPRCAIPRALETGRRIVSDEVLVKEGNRPIRVTTIPFQTDDGEWLVAEVNADLSDRRELERDLMESEEKYRTVVENAGEAIAIVDEHGTFLFMNSTAARALGGMPSDFKGKTMWELFPKDIADRQAGAVRKVIHTASGVNAVVMSPVQGELRWYNTTIQPLRDSAGTVTAGLVIARDVHALRTAQQELDAYREKMMRAEQLASLGMLSATYAHELSQPLTVIRLSLQNAMKGLEETGCPAAVLDDLSDGLAEIANLSGIIGSFRSFSRQTSERPVTEVVLSATAGQVMRLLEESAKKRRLTLRLERLDDLPPVHACEKDIGQLFFSLTQNAIQAADGLMDRHFEIAGVCRDGMVELRFADTCGGIHPDHVDRIFDPFFTTKPAGEGTGLGLCIAQRVVSQAGGRIRVDNRFGEGTTFIVTLPFEGR